MAIKALYGIQVISNGPGVLEQVRETFQERELVSYIDNYPRPQIVGRHEAAKHENENLIVGSVDTDYPPVTVDTKPSWIDVHPAIIGFSTALDTLTNA